MPYIAPQEVRSFTQVQEELRKISELLNRGDDILRIQQINASPPKPRDGDIRYADGTNWNPGTGKGLYWYDGSAWTKL